MATAEFFKFAGILSAVLLIASSFRMWNSSAGIQSPPLALLIVMLPKVLLTSHSRGSLKKAFLALFVILWNFAFKCVYLSFSPLPSISFLFSPICKGLVRQPFCLFAFLFLRDGLDHCFLYTSQTSIHSSSGALSIRSNPLNLFLTCSV